MFKVVVPPHAVEMAPTIREIFHLAGLRPAAFGHWQKVTLSEDAAVRLIRAFPHAPIPDDAEILKDPFTIIPLDFGHAGVVKALHLLGDNPISGASRIPRWMNGVVIRNQGTEPLPMQLQHLAIWPKTRSECEAFENAFRIRACREVA